MPNFTLTTFAGFVDMLRLAADEGDRSRPRNCAWTVPSATPWPIQSSCGVELIPQETLTAPLVGLAVPERQVLAWLQPLQPEVFGPRRFPVFNLQVEEGRCYGLPIYEMPGFKFGRYHHRGEATAADGMRFEVDAEDERLLRQFSDRCFPRGSGPTMAMRACMFTNTPDEHFVLDYQPRHKQVSMASPCSGHGYKFCSVISEVMADLATGNGTTRHDIGFLRLRRAANLPRDQRMTA